MSKILCIADAPGPAEFLLPVLPLLREKAEVCLLAHGKAFEFLREANPIEIKSGEDALSLYRKVKPDIVVQAISSLTNGPYIINAVVELAHEEKVPVVCLQDIWGNHRWIHNQPSVAFSKLVCTLDDFAAGLWKEDGFLGKVSVTGNPAFEKFKSINVLEERARLRARLKIPANDYVIFYAGEGTPRGHDGDKKTFKLLTEALRFVKDLPIKLIFRPHPRAEETSYYDEYAKGLNIIDTKDIHFSESLLPVADLVVSIFATNLIHACYLRIPAMSIMLSGAGETVAETLRLKDFPPNIVGASVGVYKEDPSELKETIIKTLTDKDFQNTLRLAQEKNFILDGKSAERVASAILNFK